MVKPDNTVERRTLETANTFEGKRIVKNGLKDGDKVFSTRLQLLQPGMTVKPVDEKEDSAERNRCGFGTRAEKLNAELRSSECGMGGACADLKKRTKAFALRILKLVDALPKTTAGRALASQIVRAGTSVAANYRAACCVKSPADFIAKMGIVEEEADEIHYGSSYSRNPDSLAQRS